MKKKNFAESNNVESSNKLPEKPSEDEVVLFMSNSKTRSDRNDRCDIVKSKFGGHYPDFWYEKILLAGVANKIGLNSDVKIMTIDSFKEIMEPLVELGKKKDIKIDDLKKMEIYHKPIKMPNLIGEEKFICGYDQGLGERMFICNTLEGAHELYDAYAKGRAITINRYTGKPKK